MFKPTLDKKSLVTQKIRKRLLEREKESFCGRLQNYFSIHITHKTEIIDRVGCVVLAVLSSKSSSQIGKDKHTDCRLGTCCMWGLYCLHVAIVANG